MPCKSSSSSSKRAIPKRAQTIHLNPPPEDAPSGLSLGLEGRLEGVDGGKEHAEAGGA